MGDIAHLKGIPDSMLVLLRKAGVDSVDLILTLEAGEIIARLEKACEPGTQGLRLPPVELVVAWQQTAREFLSGRVEGPVRHATEVSLKGLEAAGIPLDSIPIAEVVGDPPPARVEDKCSAPPAVAPQQDAPPPGNDWEADSESRQGEQEIRDDNAPGLPGKGDPGVRGASAPGQDRREEPVAPLEFRAMEGSPAVSVKGERRNRGMSHPEAGLVRWSATVTVVSFLCSILAAVGLVTAGVMAVFLEIRFHPSILLLILAIPGSLFIYVTQGSKARCRLCGQRLFVPKNCHKHERASRSIFGYTFAAARSAMFRANFRCMLCGTKTRLKD